MLFYIFFLLGMLQEMKDLEKDLKELYAQQKAEKQKELDAAQTASATRYVICVCCEIYSVSR